MKTRVPEKVKKFVFQEAESSCAICYENNINVLEIHHIYEQAKGGAMSRRTYYWCVQIAIIKSLMKK